MVLLLVVMASVFVIVLVVVVVLFELVVVVNIISTTNHHNHYPEYKKCMVLNPISSKILLFRCVLISFSVLDIVEMEVAFLWCFDEVS